MNAMVTMIRACVCLAILASCDGTKSEQNSRKYVHTLVTELCAPGAFYRECWWSSSDEGCHREMPFYVASSMPHDKDRVVPSEALRQHVFENVYFLHTTFVATAAAFMLDFDKEACWDGTPWKHVPPGKEGTLIGIRESVEASRRAQREASPVPTTTDTPPAPSPGTTPETSPDPVPVPAPAPAP